jgi:hypothetical protein
MKKIALMVGSLAALVCGEVRAADFFTAPVLVRQNELVTCQAMNVGITTLDVMVDLIEAGKGSVFGPANCVGTVTGGGCVLASASAAPEDRWIYCHVTPGKKKNIRAIIQVSGGAAVAAQ